MEPLSAITNLAKINGITGADSVTAGKAAAGPSFGRALEDALTDVSRLQQQASQLTKEFQAENPNVSLEETMIAMQTSSLSFQSIVQVRNKLVTAYNEMMNMQV
ncbi:MAG: flagellar hook-basal body complex protein FliE [Betaproteobacteria bacterium]|nr:flagellar hook-basal body complex protein FliE [Betaproteobacteria bacterium]